MPLACGEENIIVEKCGERGCSFHDSQRPEWGGGGARNMYISFQGPPQLCFLQLGLSYFPSFPDNVILLWECSCPVILPTSIQERVLVCILSWLSTPCTSNLTATPLIWDLRAWIMYMHEPAHLRIFLLLLLVETESGLHQSALQVTM